MGYWNTGILEYWIFGLIKEFSYQNFRIFESFNLLIF